MKITSHASYILTDEDGFVLSDINGEDLEFSEQSEAVEKAKTLINDEEYSKLWVARTFAVVSRNAANVTALHDKPAAKPWG